MNLETVYQRCPGKLEQSVGDCKTLIKYIEKIKPPNCYLEVGTRWGGSAYLAKAFAPQGVDVYTVDVYEPSVDTQLLKEVGAKFFHEYSTQLAEVWGLPIQVLFIDGNHEEALQDFLAWERHVVKGGVILFHDYANHSPTVMKNCDEIAKRKDYEVLFKPIFGETDTGIFQIRKL